MVKSFTANRLHVSIIVFALIASLVLTLAGCGNMLEDSAKKDTTEAVLFEARKLMNKRDYEGAIEQIDSLPSALRSRRDIAVLRASAYAGRCGLDFIQFVHRMQNQESSTTLLQLFLNMMRESDEWADCLTAEDAIEVIGATASERTDDENLLMAFVSFAKVGAILAATGNADEDDNGTADVGFNACQSLTRAEAAEIATGIAIAIESLNESAPDLFGNAVTNLSSLCTAVGGCSTNPADYDTTERDAIRTAVHDDDGSIGLGTQDPQTDPLNDVCMVEGT